MDSLIKEFKTAYAGQLGNDLAKTLTPDIPNNAAQMMSVWESGNSQSIKEDLKFLFVRDKSARLNMSSDEAVGWQEIYHSYWKALGEILAVEGLRKSRVKMRERGNNGDDTITNFQDDFDPETEKHKSLEDCARQLNRIFNLCLSDRAPLSDSRKWGIYYAINLLFKTYFKLNSAALSKNVLKVLSAGRGDMPDFESFPKSQQVTFKYYEGVLAFLEENYEEAEKHLTLAWLLCHKGATRNIELILTYLIPCHLLTTHTLPSAELLAPFPRLQALFLKLATAIKKGDLRGFHQALQEGEDEFVKRRIYLTLERGRDIALRNLLRKVFIAGGFMEGADGGAPVRRTRIPVTEFAAAIRMSSGQDIDTDEVECLLANMIYKNLMKGYIAHERGFVVLSKTGAFPGTGV
ncbi:Protein CSN12-like protein [Apiospora arundinis]